MTQPSPPTVVLVVDDEPLIRLYAVDVLQDAGFTVIEAEDAETALEAIDLHPEVGVLFTDIKMPGACDGLDLARKVHDRRPDIQLIIASGHRRLSKAEIPDNGAFLAKPYDGWEVAKLITAGDRIRYR